MAANTREEILPHRCAHKIYYTLAIVLREKINKKNKYLDKNLIFIMQNYRLQHIAIQYTVYVNYFNPRFQENFLFNSDIQHNKNHNLVYIFLLVL